MSLKTYFKIKNISEYKFVFIYVNIKKHIFNIKNISLFNRNFAKFSFRLMNSLYWF